MNENFEKIIFLRTDRIGDNLMAMSMLPYIRQRFKAAEIIAVCPENIRFLYETCPDVNQILSFDINRLFTDSFYLEQIIRKIQTFQADLILNTVYSSEEMTEILVTNSKAKNLLGFEGDLSNISEELRQKYKRYYTKLVKNPAEKIPELEHFRNFLNNLGIDAPFLLPKIWLTSDDEQFASDIFTKHNLNPESTITIFLNSMDKNRQYEKYNSVLSYICASKNLSVIALGSEADYQDHQQVLDQLPAKTLNMCGITLRQSAAIIKKVKLNVGIETSFAHMANALEAESFIVLGGGFIGRYFPYSRYNTVVSLPLICSGCNYYCRYQKPHCTRDISELVVTEALQQCIETSSMKARLFFQENYLWSPDYNQPIWKSPDNLINLNGIELIPVDSNLLLKRIEEVKYFLKNDNDLDYEQQLKKINNFLNFNMKIGSLLVRYQNECQKLSKQLIEKSENILAEIALKDDFSLKQSVSNILLNNKNSGNS